MKSFIAYNIKLIHLNVSLQNKLIIIKKKKKKNIYF